MKIPDRASALTEKIQRNAASIDFEGAFPIQEFDLLHEAGLLGREVVALPPLELLQALWHVGRGNLAVGRLYEGHINALQLVHWFGDTPQRERLFADADAGKLFAVWNTQANDGVHFQATNDGFELRGCKTFCSGAGQVERPIVTGTLPDGGWQMACLRVEAAQLGIDPSWWQPMGMRASASFKTDFSGSQLKKDDLLGEPDAYYAQPAFSGGAIRFCAVQLGGAAALFDETRRFLRTTDRAEDAFQRARVGQMAMLVQSGWQWLRSAGELWDSLGPSPQSANEQQTKRMVAFAAAMRLATEEIGNSVMALAEKSVGARGLMRNEPFERLIRDLTIYLKQPHLDEIPGRVGKFALESDSTASELWQP